MTHDLENIGASDLVFVTVEFVQNENKPLSLDEVPPGNILLRRRMFHPQATTIASWNALSRRN